MARTSTRSSGVQFAAELEQHSRPAQGKEETALRNFARHASHCIVCARPYQAFQQGYPLCSRGTAHAAKVVKYLLSSDGHAYTKPHQRNDFRQVHVEIPYDCEVSRELLRAIEHGLRLMAEPVVSYDQSYLVAPRLPPRPVQQQPTYVVAEPRRQRRAERQYVGRGSLYESDMAERERRYRRETREREAYQPAPRQTFIVDPPVYYR
jgi:hypothetical protein